MMKSKKARWGMVLLLPVLGVALVAVLVLGTGSGPHTASAANTLTVGLDMGVNQSDPGTYGTSLPAFENCVNVSTNVNNGIFYFDVFALNTTNLYAFIADLQFTPGKMQILGVDVNQFFGTSSTVSNYSTTPPITSGSFHVEAVDTGGLHTGSGVLARIQAQAFIGPSIITMSINNNAALSKGVTLTADPGAYHPGDTNGDGFFDGPFINPTGTINVDQPAGQGCAGDLSITKTGVVTPGTVTVTYTLTATNKGSATATGVTITDTLPATVSFVSASAICSQALGIVTCNVGTLAGGASASVTVTVGGIAGGPATDTGAVTGNEYDPTPGNNTATQTTVFCQRSASAGGALVYAPWPHPVGDDDCDGFTTAIENFVGTDPNIACATTVSVNAWPADINNDRRVNITDVLKFVPVFNSAAPGPPYNKRFDLNGDGRIGTSDVLKLVPFFNLSCTP
jgi:uncharacterized repeat protein (TIGR01451 family)